MARLARDAVSSDDDSSDDSSSEEGVKGKSTVKSKSSKHTKENHYSRTTPAVKQEPMSEDEAMKSGSDSESDSSSGSESSSSASSSSESESEDSIDEADVHRHVDDDIQKAIDAENAQSGNSVQAKPFTAPRSFKKVQSSISLPSEISQVFSGAGNKQIWHITAPASVPVSSISQLALDAIATGEPVLAHEGLQYRLREEQLGSDTTKHILLPDRSGTTYTKSSLRVVQTFHLEQVLDKVVQSLEIAPSKELIDRYSKPVRQQPKNLKARNTPLGVKDDDDDKKKLAKVQPSGRVPGEESDTEMREAHEESKKRKHLETETPFRKKSKIVTDASPDKSSKKEHKSKHREETSEERRARREEKKRRKKEKAQH
ncbi:hypothetical protein KEM54_005225 [Ascosphaera aggregata]|nr:hypothetical protein KEM54_005225 [Ascosphaera aggregata]